MYPETVEQTENLIKGIGGDIETMEEPDVLLVNKELHVSLILVHWSDLGDWTSVWAENLEDKKGNVNLGEPTLIGCK